MYEKAANECGADKRNKRNELIRCFGLAFYENWSVGEVGRSGRKWRQ